MAFTTYRTYQPGDLITAAILNQDIRDNGEALALKNYNRVSYRGGSNYVITGTSFGDVDSTNVAGSLTLSWGTRIRFTGHLWAAYAIVSGTYGALDIALNGTRVGDASYGIETCIGNGQTLILDYIATGLTRGNTYTWKLQARKTNAADTFTLYNTSTFIVITAEEF